MGRQVHTLGMHPGRMTPTFTIVMPSYLGNYPGAAKNREAKLCRAIDSVIQQTCSSWELIVVADGCERTADLVEQFYGDNQKITTILIEKQPLWDPSVRNIGIRRAKGKWVIYLDTDDYYGSNHLDIVSRGLQLIDTGWAWFNDLEWNRTSKQFVERHCDIGHKDKHGTSNLVHLKALEVYWDEGTYKQDAFFAGELKNSGPGTKIPTPEYCVAHVPNRYDL